MRLTLGELKIIQEDFIKEKYFNDPTYDKYVIGCAISNLRVMKDTVKDITLKPNESLDDLCLSILLSMKPPKNLGFPLNYMDVRVFCYVIGQPKAY